MNRTEIALLLGAIAARDSRTTGEADVLAWLEDLGDLEFADARAAVSRHFRDSTDRIMPAHIRRIARIIRDERRKGETIRGLPPNKFELAAAAEPPAEIRDFLTEFTSKHEIPDVGIQTPANPPPVVDRSEEIRQRALARARSERRGRRS